MKRLLFFLLLLSGGCISIASEVILFDGKHPITYQLPEKVSPVVKTAFDMWRDDMLQVTGTTPECRNQATIRIIEGHGDDDGFRLYAKNGQVVVEGFSERGTAYGLLELSRLAGVSPWIWWGDVVPKRLHRLTFDSNFVTEQHPSVQYRGVFLNDEDWSLRPWSRHAGGTGNNMENAVRTYKRIFQLLLRLRANTVWPAMHEGTTAFFLLPGAKATADSCGIVIGTSHCEPLLRNNVGEWDKSVRGPFNYRTNRRGVLDYWTERLSEVSLSPNNLLTIGMRGIHDSSMEGYHTMQEKLDGLQQVIDDQQELISRYMKYKQTQVFVPYKEVLQLYEMGLNVPDYVTLMWCDDNYGYMTRYSSPSEQQRSGGGGVYYHLSYWGRPHDYLWLCTTQPGLIYQELREAYDHHMRRLWIANIHDPKVAGYQLELFLDLAWNINCTNHTELSNHYKNWLCRQFGLEAGEKLFPAMHEFYRLCGERRPEFMGWTQVELDKKRYHRGLSPVCNTELTTTQAAARLAVFDQLEKTVEHCNRLIRPDLNDAYFAAIAYPVLATSAMNHKILSDSAESHQAYLKIQALNKQYNKLGNGKWQHIMDAAPRRLPVFEDVRASLAKDTLQGRSMYHCHAANYTTYGGVPKTIQMLGHSMQAVALPCGAFLNYTFDIKTSGEYWLTVALIPTHPVDRGELRFTTTIDEEKTDTFNLKEPFRSERWKENVLRGQAIRTCNVHLEAGSHILTLHAVDPHIIVDQWAIVQAKPKQK